MSEEAENIKLVQLVEAQPCLWDPAHKSYANKNVTDKVWLEIANQMNISEKECRKRMTNIRTVFRRHLNQKLPTGSQASAKKSYYLSEYLQFLVPVIISKKPLTGNLPPVPSNASNTGEFVETVLDDTLDYDSAIDTPKPQEQSDEVSRDKKEEEVNGSNETASEGPKQRDQPSISSNEDGQKTKPKNNKRKQDPLDAALTKYLEEKTKAKKTPANDSSSDSDEKFLLSLKDDMRSMSAAQKRCFKRRIFELIDEIMGEKSCVSAAPPGHFSTTSGSTSSSSYPPTPTDFQAEPSPSVLHYNNYPMDDNSFLNHM